ncbi:MAG: cache domain-containing protein [Bacillota bacterium]|nr:cache domain-containing protein [Bacillota bacterium]
MRSLKHQLLILLLGSLVILAVSFVIVLGWYMKDRDVAAANFKAQADLATCGEIIDVKYPGSWSIRDGKLYKGTIKISLNNDVVDYLAQLTGDTVTVFLGDSRVATTVRGSNGERVIGTKVSANVAQTVLKNGQTYVGVADVVGQRYQTAYAPLRSENGDIIGMFYVGISHVYEQEFINKSLITMAELVLTLTILVGLFTFFVLQKLFNRSLQDIMLGTEEVVAEVYNQKVSNEQFQAFTGEIAQSVNSNNLEHDPLTNDGNSFERFKDTEQISELLNNDTVTQGPEPLYGLQTPWYSGAEELPKGLNKATLDQIVQFLKETHRPVSTEEVSEGVTLTRVTVRRYLEFLEQCGILKSEQKCGTVGRPVKIFIPL